MKPSMWVMAVAFLAVSIPVLLLMHKFDLGGEYRLMIAIALGALASAVAQGLAARRKDEQE